MNCMVFRTFAIVAVVVSLPLTTCSIRVHAASYRVLSTVSEGILYMRTGPGTGHPLVVAIPAGATGVQVGECRQPDDGGKKPWCSVSWRGYRGWVSSCCIVPEVTAHSPQSTPATSAIISYPVVFTRAADLRTLGVAVRSYGTDAKSTTRHQYGCYYSGDGGYDTPPTLSSTRRIWPGTPAGPHPETSPMSFRWMCRTASRADCPTRTAR
jgi:uncharacterized protein YraI